MTTELITAILALIGTGVGSLTGIILNNRLVTYRLKQLEKKVDAHNHLVERMAVVETEIETLKADVEDYQ